MNSDLCIWRKKCLGLVKSLVCDLHGPTRTALTLSHLFATPTTVRSKYDFFPRQKPEGDAFICMSC